MQIDGNYFDDAWVEVILMIPGEELCQSSELSNDRPIKLPRQEFYTLYNFFDNLSEKAGEEFGFWIDKQIWFSKALSFSW